MRYTMSKMPPRLIREFRTVEVMISLYCRIHHRYDELCSDCKELASYALERLEKCPFQEEKPTCAKCPVHCYKPTMRKKISQVMRYAGPRMAYRHPVLALFHLIDGRRKRPVKRTLSKWCPTRCHLVLAINLLSLLSDSLSKYGHHIEAKKPVK